MLRARPLGENDALVVCGDLGLIWDGSPKEQLRLDFLEQELRCLVLFVSGNHENFDLLAAYPKTRWQGGLVQAVRPHLFHLMRGQVYTILGKTLFTMGGASSHDVDAGILEADDPALAEKCRALDAEGAFYRVRHVSWWEQELPNRREMAAGWLALARCGWKVDVIVTHCLPSHVQDLFSRGLYRHDRLTDYFDRISRRARFSLWVCGHYHHDKLYAGRYRVLYHDVLPLE